MKLRLESKRIILRELKKSDAVSIHQNARDKKISKYTTLPYPYKLKDAEDFIKKTCQSIKRKNAYEMGIEFKEEKQIIGMMGLMNINYKNKNAEIGYWLGKKYWRKGLTKEASNLIIDFGFKELRLERIYAKVMHPNIASQKLLEKIGFKLEGRLRRDEFKNNKWYDDFIYAILKEEYKKTKQK